MLGLVTFPVAGLDAARADRALDPRGLWSCVTYGDPAYGDERMTLRVLDAGRVDVTHRLGGGLEEWMRLSEWSVEKRRLTFSDFRRGRIYAADLDRSTLGGTWTAASAAGGWWCVRRGDAATAETIALRRSAPEFYVPPLVINVMATPRYPRQAIRQAKEGRAVACFIVESSGTVRDPEFLELSDEIFRDSTVAALLRSNYLPWEGDATRPGCRSFTYELEVTY